MDIWTSFDGKSKKKKKVRTENDRCKSNKKNVNFGCTGRWYTTTITKDSIQDLF